MLYFGSSFERFADCVQYKANLNFRPRVRGVRGLGKVSFYVHVLFAIKNTRSWARVWGAVLVRLMLPLTGGMGDP